METPPQIVDRIRQDLPNILTSWKEERTGSAKDEPSARMVAGIEELIMVFAGFLESPEGVEGFSRGGEIRTLVARIADEQHTLGRDAVGVIEDFSVLRRCVWRSVEGGVDLSEVGGSGVARFFVKLLQASDWVTEQGLKAFEATAMREMERALVRAEATDLVTGLPDREQFNRLLLPAAVREHEKFALLAFDVVHFTETVAEGNLSRARGILRRLAETVAEVAPETAVCARFGDDEVCAILPGSSSEEAYRIAERVSERLAEVPDGFEVDAGVAEYPAHGSDAAALMTETLKALGTAKRVGGGGIVVAR
ncbi:MAG: GGDEF domain protein [uncultured Rubrobacteraceae bacterium]|uniref:GGDEF domain protein n=1 Tax=uncultured Rubrobacteraceae bacterium TaxID=349277 RepID=A0A6J4QJN2_9ACTN|nr:MAG: GGDEF domain protein [uncultured Rubrobacteraceae bacterium]